MTYDPKNPMAEFVDVIRGKWWQSTTPPVQGHTIGRDLSVVRYWLKNHSREDLLGALGMYDGAPATLLLLRADTVRRPDLPGYGLLSRLLGEYWKSEELKGCHAASILQRMASEGLI